MLVDDIQITHDLAHMYVYIYIHVHVYFGLFSIAPDSRTKYGNNQTCSLALQKGFVKLVQT